MGLVDVRTAARSTIVIHYLTFCHEINSNWINPILHTIGIELTEVKTWKSLAEVPS
jgi:hypothetical protein